MRRALGVELARLRWRRSVVLLLLAAVVVPVLVAASVLWSTRPITDADRADAAAQVAAQREDPGTRQILTECERRPRQWGVGRAARSGDPAAVTAACEEMILLDEQAFLERPPMRVGWVLANNGGLAVVASVALFVLLLGATFVGHDWSTSSMSNQVLFEPRRLRLWGAKALAVALVATVLAAAVLGAFWATMYAAQAAQGLSSRPEVSGLVWSQSWRGVLLVAAAGVGGFALTMLLRSTVAVVGLLFAVAVVVPIVVATSGSLEAQRFLPPINATAWVVGVQTIPRWEEPGCESAAYDRRDPAYERCTLVVDRTDAALYLGGLLALAGGASTWSFRRRDVG